MEVKIPEVAEEAKAAPNVPSIDDLLMEIFLRLPVLSLVRFKLVSKYWLALITGPDFCRLRNPHPNPATGLFCRCTDLSRDRRWLQYVPFCPNKSSNPPLGKLYFLRDAYDIRILQSCNGLFLCCRYWIREPYYVYNPTTNYISTLAFPKLLRRRPFSYIVCLSLAFDPAKSRHYKVVCVRNSMVSGNNMRHQIEVYSSKTGKWSASGEPFLASVNFGNGVYWNGGIHWISEVNTDSLCFNLDHQKIRKMPRPPAPNESYDCIDESSGLFRFSLPLLSESDWNENYYFGESCGHLCFIPIGRWEIRFNVYEMKRDYSEWFVSYKIDLSTVIAANPSVDGDRWISFYVFAAVRGKEEDDAFLVLRIPGKAIRYKIRDMTFEELDGFEGVALIEGERDRYEYQRSLRVCGANAYQYIESLYYL